MQTIEQVNRFNGNSDVYRVEQKAPKGNYVIWNIGKNAPVGYVPFCRILPGPHEWSRNIDRNDLVAVPSKGAEAIMEAVGFGPDTSEAMRKFVAAGEKHPSETGRYAEWILERMRKAIPYLEEMGR